MPALDQLRNYTPRRHRVNDEACPHCCVSHPFLGASITTSPSGKKRTDCWKQAVAVRTNAARDTILPYLREKGHSAEVWPELAEACWQTERRLPPLRTASRDQLMLADEFQDCLRVREGEAFLPHGDEVFEEGLTRIVWVKDELLSRHSGREETVLVVGHGHAGGRLIEMLLGLPPREHGSFDHANTGLPRLDERPDGTIVLRFANRI